LTKKVQIRALKLDAGTNSARLRLDARVRYREGQALAILDSNQTAYFDYLPGEGAAIGAIGAAGELIAAGEAIEALWALRLHRRTLEVEMPRSLATSFGFLPALSSSITLSQSTFPAAWAFGIEIAKLITVASARVVATATIFLVTFQSLPLYGASQLRSIPEKEPY
jgi:hypothetical protein